MPDHPTCLLRNLYTGQEATVRTGHGTTDWFRIGKEVGQGCILSPCLFNLHAEYIMRNAGLDEAHAGRNINNFRYEDDTTLMAESEELKSLLKKVKEESEKVDSENEDHGIWSHHFMGNRRGKKQWQTLFFWVPKSLQMVIATMKLKDAYSLEEKL